jgi:hypothetical protein
VKYLAAIGVAVAFSVSTAGGQSGSTASPADVAREFFAAERDARWLDAARMLDLKSFEAQRAQSVANARRTRDAHPFHLTVDEILRHDPSMPRAVAEYQVKQAEQSFRDFNPLADEYADVPTADSLAALPVDLAAARWLEAKDPRWVMKREARSSGECAQVYDSLLKRPSALDSVAASMFMLPRPEVVAVASGGSTAGSSDSLSYVIFRELYETTLDSTARPRMAVLPMQMSPSVLTMIRTPAGWRVRPVQDLGYAHGTFGFSFDCAIDSVKPRAKKR